MTNPSTSFVSLTQKGAVMTARAYISIVVFSTVLGTAPFISIIWWVMNH